MRDDAVQCPSSMERIEADPRPCAQMHVATIDHIGRVGGQHQIDLDGDVRFQILRCDDGPTQVELFLHRKNQVNRWAAGPLGQCISDGQLDRAAGPIINTGADDPILPNALDTWPVDNGRTDSDAGLFGLRFACKASVNDQVRCADDLILLIRCRGVVRLVGDDAGHVPAFTDAQQHRLGGQRALWHAAKALNLDEPILDNLADDKP
jgi:hypothetical protein